MIAVYAGIYVIIGIIVAALVARNSAWIDDPDGLPFLIGVCFVFWPTAALGFTLAVFIPATFDTLGRLIITLAGKEHDQ